MNNYNVFDGTMAEDFNLTTGQVARMLGIDHVTVQQWCNRHLIRFESEAAGRRSWRRIHCGELPRLVLAAQLWRNQLLISDAFEMANHIISRLRDPKKSRVEYIFYFIGDDAKILYLGYRSQFELNSADPIADAFRRYQRAACVMISVTELGRQIDAAVKGSLPSDA